MKKIRIFYWITTGLFVLMMLFSSVSSVLMRPQSEEVFKSISMPFYLISFISVAKLLAVIAILVPGYPRLKEWAYAGLVYDLLGAWYSSIAVGTPAAGWIFFVLFL